MRVSGFGGLLVSTCLFVLLGYPNAEAATVTASHVPSAGGSFDVGAGKAIDPPAPNPFDNWLAQTFVATVKGKVQQVSFRALDAAYMDATAPLRVDIASVVGGLPGAALATAYVAPEVFPSYSSQIEIDIFADFSATGLVLQEGTPYALVFSSDTANANYRFRGKSGSNPYPGGNYFRSQNGAPWSAGTSGDLYFTVTVTPVPEPSSLVLAGMGCVAIALFARKRARAAKVS